MLATIRSPSHLLDDLPSIYRDDPFIGQFLLAFEHILLGFESGPPSDLQNTEIVALETQIGHIADYFDPLQTPPDFLPWLASWVALTLRADLPVPVQRQFIANILRYYRFRGTKANLQALLSLFVQGQPTVEETSSQELQIGVHSTIGVDTNLRGGAPHFFTVTLVLPDVLRADNARQLAIASAIIELEKPAHTDYELIPIFPGTICVGQVSTVGVDTVLGNIPTVTASQSSNP